MTLPSANTYRLDWRSEFKKLRPFLEGQGGVVRVDIPSDKCAADKFNHIIKEEFGKPGNSSWLSLRIDHDWSTTYTVEDQILAFEKKLAEANIAVKWPQTSNGNVDNLSGNRSGRDMEITVTNSTINYGFDSSPHAVRARIDAVCEAVRKFVELGGHFMVIVNDMKVEDQGHFLSKFWNAGLREAGGSNVLLLYFVGPRCGHNPHADAPAPELQFSLPTAISGDENREEAVYDDIFDIFTSAGYGGDAAGMAADSLISGHGDSVKTVQTELAKLILRMKLKSKEGRT